MLDKLEKAYRAGDKKALWQAIIHCARWKEPLPDWLCEAIELANLKDFTGELDSFDTVFGKPRTKKQADNLKRDHDLALQVARLADEADAASKGRSEGWFEEVGETIGFGKTKVKELLDYARHVMLRRAGK